MSLDNQFVFINFILFYIALSLVLVFSIITIVYYYKKKDELEDSDKKSVFSWMLFFIIIVIQLFIMSLWKFWITDVFLANILERIANTLVFLAMLIKVIDIERSCNKLDYYKGYWFSIVSGISMSISILIDPVILKVISPFQMVFVAMMFCGVAIFPIIYFYVAIKSLGNIRTNALLVSAGAVFIGLGYLFRPANLIAYRVDPILNILVDYLYITFPISLMIGFTLIFISMRNK